MKTSRFTGEQITYAIRHVESGTPPADVCRQLGCSEASFYVWKKRYGNMGLTEVIELRQLRDENARSVSRCCARLWRRSQRWFFLAIPARRARCLRRRHRIYGRLHRRSQIC